MNDNIKKIEKNGYLKAILKKEYPRYISKNFSDKVMTEIYASKNTTIKSYMLRVASAFIFGIFTLFVMDNILNKEIQYSKTNIVDEPSAPSQNVSTDSEDCRNYDDKRSTSDIIECK